MGIVEDGAYQHAVHAAFDVGQFQYGDPGRLVGAPG